jgi:hypothetical protein
MNIYTDKSLAADFTGDWITNPQQVAFDKPSIQLEWKEVTGTTDGVLKIELTNDVDGNKPALLKSITIDSASNVSDSYLLQIDYVFEAMRIKYVKNSITGGKLYAEIKQRS